jgi:hypothetical protein
MEKEYENILLISSCLAVNFLDPGGKSVLDKNALSNRLITYTFSMFCIFIFMAIKTAFSFFF